MSRWLVDFFQSLWPSQVIWTLFWNLSKNVKIWNFWFFQSKDDNSWLYQVTLPWLQKKKFQSHLKRDETKVSGLAEHLLFFAPFQIFPLLPQFSVYFSFKNPGLGIQRWLQERLKVANQHFLILLSIDISMKYIRWYAKSRPKLNFARYLTFEFTL